VPIKDTKYACDTLQYFTIFTLLGTLPSGA